MSNSSYETILRLVVGLALAGSAGCDRLTGFGRPEAAEPTERLPALAALDAPPGRVVVAQGQFEPAGGVIAIVAAPGDRIRRIRVDEKDAVEAGQVVAELESLRAQDAELRAARMQLTEAEARLEAETAAAEARVEAARVGLEQAQLELEQAEAQDASHLLAERQLELARARLEQLESTARDPSAGSLVSQNAIREQQLRIEEAEVERQMASQRAEAAARAAQLAVRAAELELEAAQAAVERVAAAAPTGSLEAQVELLALRREAAELTSPIDGVVLSVDASEGQVTTEAPLARIANTGEMTCVAEVDVAELPRIAVGARARMSSPALRAPVAGRVSKISRLVGTPRLASPNPMARVDWRAAEVTIAIEPEDAERAAEFVQLQVDVAIEATEE